MVLYLDIHDILVPSVHPVFSCDERDSRTRLPAKLTDPQMFWGPPILSSLLFRSFVHSSIRRIHYFYLILVFSIAMASASSLFERYSTKLLETKPATAGTASSSQNSAAKVSSGANKIIQAQKQSGLYDTTKSTSHSNASATATKGEGTLGRGWFNMKVKDCFDIHHLDRWL